MDYSNYDITRFEDLDEDNMDYRNNKRIPRWAANSKNYLWIAVAILL